MHSEVIAAAIAEARRLDGLSDRDLSADLRPYERTMSLVCARWRLRPVAWMAGGVNPPPPAESIGVDAERIWQWAFVERVTTGLYLHWFGHAEQGLSFLDTAEALARREGQP